MYSHQSAIAFENESITFSVCDVDCNNTDYLRFYTIHFTFLASGCLCSNMRVFVALILSSFVRSHSFKALFHFSYSIFVCSFHCVKIYVTRGCTGFLLFHFNVALHCVLYRVHCNRNNLFTSYFHSRERECVSSTFQTTNGKMKTQKHTYIHTYGVRKMR